MMNIKKKFLMLATAAVVVLPVTFAIAATENVEVTATFRAALTLAEVSSMEFGKIDFANMDPAAGSYVRMGTDASRTSNGDLTASAGIAQTAAVITATATTGETLTVACDVDVTLRSVATAGKTIKANAFKVKEGAGSAYGVGDNDCNGTPWVTGAVVAGTKTIRIGGQIDGDTEAGTLEAGAYSSAAAGDNLVVTVLYN